tara:strand:+ start:3541 stop:3825 length:285 start_codon:yes stop_codon:yes gene_type:complete
MIATLKIAIFIPTSQSLKDKRRVVNRIKGRLRSRYNVSVAETGGNDKWQRVELTIAMAGNSKHHLEKEIQTVQTAIDNICLGYAEILSVIVDFI